MQASLLDTEALVVDPQTASRDTFDSTRESSSMRTVNASMRALSGSFPRSEPIPFFCECHDPDCFSTVWMTADIFDATIAGHTGWMLVEHHDPSALWHTKELPPAPETRRTVRTNSEIEERAPRPARKRRGVLFHQRLVRAS
jgi:hypothetical protein